jgi:uncharacterized protein YydD (DUF2326 family)
MAAKYNPIGEARFEYLEQRIAQLEVDMQTLQTREQWLTDSHRELDAALTEIRDMIERRSTHF